MALRHWCRVGCLPSASIGMWLIWRPPYFSRNPRKLNTAARRPAGIVQMPLSLGPIESLNGRFRDELLNLWHFDSLREARVIIEDGRIDYNWQRPHTAHGDLTPAEFAATWTTNPPQAA